MTMVRIRKEKRRPATPETETRIKELEAEIGRILDFIFNHPGDDNRERIERMGWLEKRIMDLSGERTLEINEDFRR